jgi:regulator of sigma E protease
MIFLENFWWLLVLIGVMILIHELGHYWAARWFDVYVESFSFGFGPRLFGFRRGETDFRVSLIPFGGYVKMLGEQPGEEGGTENPRSFLNKPRWQRLIIAFAGPAMNIVLAVALLTGLYMVHYPKLPQMEGAATIGQILQNSPAAKAGLQEGDVIVRLEEMANPSWEDIMMRELVSAQKPVPVIVDRKGQQLRFVVTPELDPRTNVGSAGWAAQSEVVIGDTAPGRGAEKAGLQRGDVILAVNGQKIRSALKLHELIGGSQGKPIELTYSRKGTVATVPVQPALSKEDPKYPEGRWMIGVLLQPQVVVSQLPFGEALTESVKNNVRGATLIFSFLRGIVEQRMSPKSLEGPIRIAKLAGDAAREGWVDYISLMAMVSLNLAIFNLLPIPILDGGVILMLLIEMLMRRDLSLRVKETVFKLGFVFLMALVVFVFYNDLTKIGS